MLRNEGPFFIHHYKPQFEIMTKKLKGFGDIYQTFCKIILSLKELTLRKSSLYISFVCVLNFVLRRKKRDFAQVFKGKLFHGKSELKKPTQLCFIPRNMLFF